MATNNSTVKFVEISRASFNSLTKDANTFYVVIETDSSRKLYQGSNLLTGIDTNTMQTALNAKQNTLVSGTNIKTVNGNSLLGSGNITIAASGGGGAGSWQLVRTVTGSSDGDYIYFNGLLNSLTNGTYMIQLTFREDMILGVNYNMTFLFERYDTGTSIGFPILIDGDGGGTSMYSLTNEGNSTSAYISDVYGASGPIDDIMANAQVKLYRKVY